MKQEVASFLDYVAHSPTVFQAAQQACDMLDAAGFTRLSEHEAWEILPGGRVHPAGCGALRRDDYVHVV